MKRFLTVVGGIALAALVLILSLVAVAAVKGRRLDDESKRYADTTILAIASTWNERVLLNQASPEFTKACPATCVDTLFAQAGKLGALEHYFGSKGQANVNFLLGKGTSVTAVYIARAEFVHGAASIKLDAIKRGGQTLGFFVRLDHALSSNGAGSA
jgi:hypothetical protein